METNRKRRGRTEGRVCACDGLSAIFSPNLSNYSQLSYAIFDACLCSVAILLWQHSRRLHENKEQGAVFISLWMAVLWNAVAVPVIGYMNMSVILMFHLLQVKTYNFNVNNTAGITVTRVTKCIAFIWSYVHDNAECSRSADFLFYVTFVPVLYKLRNFW